jgi:GYF domain 2
VPESPSKLWYFAQGEQSWGPFTEEEFARLMALGEVGPETRVWHEGLPVWVSLKEVYEAHPAATTATSDSRFSPRPPEFLNCGPDPQTTPPQVAPQRSEPKAAGRAQVTGTQLANPESGQRGWHYTNLGQTKGPVTDAELALLFASGDVNPSTLVWNPSLPDWAPAGAVFQVPPPLPTSIVSGPAPHVMPNTGTFDGFAGIGITDVGEAAGPAMSGGYLKGALKPVGIRDDTAAGPRARAAPSAAAVKADHLRAETGLSGPGQPTTPVPRMEGSAWAAMRSGAVAAGGWGCLGCLTLAVILVLIVVWNLVHPADLRVAKRILEDMKTGEATGQYWMEGVNPETLFAVRSFEYVAGGKPEPGKSWRRFRVQSSTQGGIAVEKLWDIKLERVDGEWKVTSIDDTQAGLPTMPAAGTKPPEDTGAGPSMEWSQSQPTMGTDNVGTGMAPPP